MKSQGPILSGFVLAASFTLAACAPGLVATRAQSQCGQFNSMKGGPYTLSTDEWGLSSAKSGHQCSQFDSISGSTIAWSTNWTWAGVTSEVKSFTNVESSIPQKKLRKYSSIPSQWEWNYTGSHIQANVAYDTFLSKTAGGPIAYEVMIWLGIYGDNTPLSDNGYPPKPIATPTIDGVAFDLIYGHNRGVAVYTFVAQSRHQQCFDGDLYAFYRYLMRTGIGHVPISEDLVLTNIQAGSEVFDGGPAEFKTSKYTIAVN